MIWLDILHYHQIDLEDEFLERKKWYSIMFNPWIFLQAKIPKGHPWVKSSFQLHHEFKLAEFMVNRHKQTQPPKFQKEGFAQICFTHKTNKKRNVKIPERYQMVGFKTCLSHMHFRFLIFPTWPVNLPVLLWMLPQIFGRLRLRATPGTGKERWKRTRF